MIAGAGHAPQRERPDVTLDAIAEFANRILKLHHEAEDA
jgi:pimeloyl-ACP methyl ester carboxylesterase